MSHPRRDNLALGLIAAGVSLVSFIWFFRRGEILLYGDAVAHINIARRVFDSLTPGPLQLGTVWLPLPHLLSIPFLIADWAWRWGAGGSVVSMAAYLAGALGMARLFWSGGIGSQRFSILGGWMAALVYLANPNLIYLQATAMTEALSLALGIWVIVFYAEFVNGFDDWRRIDFSVLQRAAAVRRARRRLEWCAIALAAGMLTRYDAWMLALLVAAAVLWHLRGVRTEVSLAPPLKRFLLLTILVPLLWLAYNFGVFGNPLEFATGPYSARAIARQSAQLGMANYPGERHLPVAALYFFKAAKLNLAPGKLVGIFLLAAAFGAALLLRRRKFALLLMLWLPLVFYPLSIAYGAVPIFLPVWWPFSYYNARYGLQLLPAFAASAGLMLAALASLEHKWYRRASCIALVLLIAARYAQEWKTAPITLREARANSVTRVAFEERLATELERLPQDARLLMYTGNHVGALQRAGIHLRRVISENNYPFWQSALAHPAQSAQYVIAVESDPVWRAVAAQGNGLSPLARIQVSGQPPAILYKSESAAR